MTRSNVERGGTRERLLVNGRRSRTRLSVGVAMALCISLGCSGGGKPSHPIEMLAEPGASAMAPTGGLAGSAAGAPMAPVTTTPAGSLTSPTSGSTAGAAAMNPPSSTMPAMPPATNPADAAVPAHDAGAAVPPAASGTPTLFWLDITGNQVWRANADGSGMKGIASGNGISAPDGVQVDVEGGYVYWTNMGNPLGGFNNGTVQRMKLDGTQIETIVPVGSVNTLKQMTIDRTHHKLYFCDREGAKVWRSDMDGKSLEVLVSGHGLMQLVGVALDVDRGQFYFTDRNGQKILRAGFDMPAGQTADNRNDVETLFTLGPSTMPIDLDLDVGTRMIYWTDRMEGTVHRAGMDVPAGQTSANRSDIETLASGLPDTIGISIDHNTKQVYFSQLSGTIWRMGLDGKSRTSVAQSTSATGVALIYLPAK